MEVDYGIPYYVHIHKVTAYDREKDANDIKEFFEEIISDLSKAMVVYVRREPSVDVEGDFSSSEKRYVFSCRFSFTLPSRLQRPSGKVTISSYD